MDFKKIFEKNMATIREQLHTKEPSFESTAQYQELTTISAEEARKILLEMRNKNPLVTNLTNLVCEFHHKMFLDKNEKKALTEVLIKSAIPKALKLDQKVNITNAADFPLFGYVLSLKDTYKMKGTWSTSGLMKSSAICKEETPFTDYIESKGAVFLCKANIPQMLFAFESTNNIFGFVQNPFDSKRTAGGSSGGDACLVAIGHVNAALGSDVSGSLRIPAAFCGVYSLSMTPLRNDQSTSSIPFHNLESFAGLRDIQFCIRLSLGPITRNVDDLEKLTEIFVNYYEINPLMMPIKWKGTNYHPKRIGVIREVDNIMELTLTNRRAMDISKRIINEAGIETVEIDMREYFRELCVYVAAMFNKNMFLFDVLSGKVSIDEPLISAFDNFVKMIKTPLWMVKILSKFYPDDRVRIFLEGIVIARKFNCNYIFKKIMHSRNLLLEQMEKNEIEVLLCPSMMPAVLKDTSKNLSVWVFYMNIWNAFGFPSGHVPITKVAENEQIYESKFNGLMEKTMKKNMENSKGLPVGIQVVSTPWNDEKVIAVMRILEKGTKNIIN